MKIVPIPCLRDNYAYLIICEATGKAGIGDPSEAAPVLAEVKNQDVALVAILNTHHHWDHVGGNREILDKFPDLKVYAHKSDHGRVEGQTEFLTTKDTIPLGNLSGHLTHNPAHTTGAVTYYFEDAAFTGDTMFAAGCGRIFEGTPAQMHDSLCNQIGAHDERTKIYFGHEYTENNLRFALTVEPDNQAVQNKLERVREQRAAGAFTTPSTLADEWATNPFMRSESAQIRETVKRHEPDNDLSPTSVLRVVRALMDKF